jgi:hypothetical protein
LIRAALILGLAALILIAPALIHGAPTADSGTYNHVWTSQIASEMARGAVYPRWLPYSFEGLGAPTFYFYPPLAYLLSGALAHFLDPGRAIAAAGFLLLFASGAAMYLWLRSKASEVAAIAGGLIYIAAPYHLTDFYVRSALAEFAAFVWLPLIALAIEGQPKRWAGPLLALSCAGLVCTHLPVALLTIALLIPPLVLRAAWKDPWIALRCAAAGVAGLAVSALYLLPALTLQEHTLMPQLMWSAHFDVRNWSVLRLFGGFDDELLRAAAWLAAGWAVIAAAAVLRGGRFWPAVTLWAAVCSLNVVPLAALPILDRVQFPWRGLVIVEFAAITAAVLWRPSPAAVAVGAFLLFQGVQPLYEAAQVALRPRILPSSIARMVDAVEYLPSAYQPVPKTRVPAGLDAYRGPLVEGAVADVAAGKDGSVSLRATADGRVTIRRANFPRWRVEGPGYQVPVLPGPLVSFEAKAGRTYRLIAVGTPAEAVGGGLTLFGLVLTALLWVYPRRRTRGPVTA